MACYSLDGAGEMSLTFYSCKMFRDDFPFSNNYYCLLQSKKKMFVKLDQSRTIAHAIRSCIRSWNNYRKPA